MVPSGAGSRQKWRAAAHLQPLEFKTARLEPRPALTRHDASKSGVASRGDSHRLFSCGGRGQHSPGQRRQRQGKSSIATASRARYYDDNGWFKSGQDQNRSGGSERVYYRDASGSGQDNGASASSGSGSEQCQPLQQQSQSQSQSEGRQGDGGWRVRIIIVGVSMLLCNLDRVAKGILAIPLLTEFNISLTQMGVLQSSYLWGYLIGQIPAGLASDRYGGVKVMLCGLFMWSLATCGTAAAKFSAFPLTIAIVSRVLMGLGSSVALPAVAATVAKSVPDDQKARSTTLSYALFNIGNVVANLCTPYVSEFVGWHWSFLVYGALGLLWTAVSANLFVRMQRREAQQTGSSPPGLFDTDPAEGAGGSVSGSQDGNGSGNASGRADGEGKAVRARGGLFGIGLRKKFLVQLFILMYCHSTIGLGYFTLQSWIPTFMAKDLGIVNLKVAGLCTALVWLATSFNTAYVGVIADKLLVKMPFWKVRRMAMTISTLIPAGCFLALSATTSPLVGVACILIGLVSWSCDYAGFHPYIVEVSGRYSGTVLSLTNSAGIIAGIVGNIATGYSVSLEGNFNTVFKVLSAVYLLSFVLWNLFMKGEKLEFLTAK